MRQLTITVKIEIDEWNDVDSMNDSSHVEDVKNTLKKHLREMAADAQRTFFEQYDEIMIRTEVK